MNIKKSLLVAGAVTSIGAAGLGGNALVSAQSKTDGNDSLATKIAQKFNLKTEDVQSVINEDRSAKEAEHQAKVTAELDTLVKDGKLTSAQKDAIVAKQKEQQSQRESNKDSIKDKTEAERKAARETEKTNLEAWAKQNNIPTEYLRFVHGGGPGGHGGPAR